MDFQRQWWTAGAVGPPFQFAAVVGAIPLVRAPPPPLLPHLGIAAAQVPPFHRRHREAGGDADRRAAGRQLEMFQRAADRELELADAAERMKLVRILVIPLVQRGVVGIDDDDQRVRVGLKLQMPQHRRENLHDMRPATGTQRRLHDLHTFAQHRFDQDPDRCLVGGRFAEEADLHDLLLLLLLLLLLFDSDAPERAGVGARAGARLSGKGTATPIKARPPGSRCTTSRPAFRFAAFRAIRARRRAA